MIMFVIHLFLAIFFIFFGIGRYIVRTVYDLIMYVFLRVFGRTPTSDSWVAWKIAGHGLGRTHY